MKRDTSLSFHCLLLSNISMLPDTDSSAYTFGEGKSNEIRNLFPTFRNKNHPRYFCGTRNESSARQLHCAEGTVDLVSAVFQQPYIQIW